MKLALLIEQHRRRMADNSPALLGYMPFSMYPSGRSLWN